MTESQASGNIRRKWTCLIAITLLIGLTSIANATMPQLTDAPSKTEIAHAPIAACMTWAKQQDQEAKDMWGVLIDGRSSGAVAILRLATYCLDDQIPEIVGAMSSNGAMAYFCQGKPPEFKICPDDLRNAKPDGQ